MANLIYTIPVEGLEADQMIEAFAMFHGWSETNEIDAVEFSRLVLNKFIEDAIANFHASQAAEQAREASLQAVKSTIGEVTTTLEISE